MFAYFPIRTVAASRSEHVEFRHQDRQQQGGPRARRGTALLAGLASLVSAGLFLSSPEASAEPGVKVVSSQELCNQVWPFSVAMPDAAKFGTVCVRQGGVLTRLAKAMPAMFSDTVTLEPGSTPALPAGSARVNPDDALSAWTVPTGPPNR